MFSSRLQSPKVYNRKAHNCGGNNLDRHEQRGPLSVLINHIDSDFLY